MGSEEGEEIGSGRLEEVGDGVSWERHAMAMARVGCESRSEIRI